MITRRRLSLQITPILDMLLIVLFMQFLDMRQKSSSAEAQAAASVASVEEMKAQLDQAQANSDRIHEEHAAIARTLSEVFKLTPAETKAFLAEMKPVGSNGPTAAAQSRLKQLAAGSPEPILQHLLTYDEIRKRCDVWELFLDGQNVAHLDTGERQRELRVNLNDDQDAEIERFSVELEGIYRSLPQPKHLVILMLSYDRDTRISVRNGVVKTLPQMVDRLNAASSGLTRFEYADMGLRRVAVETAE